MVKNQGFIFYFTIQLGNCIEDYACIKLSKALSMMKFYHNMH